MVGRCLLIPGASLCLVTLIAFEFESESKEKVLHFIIPPPFLSLGMPMIHLPFNLPYCQTPPINSLPVPPPNLLHIMLAFSKYPETQPGA